jgi:hypothetical protein
MLFRAAVKVLAIRSDFKLLQIFVVVSEANKSILEGCILLRERTME